MTNILIPTDFTPASIKMAEQALEVLELRTVNIVFFHVFHLPSSEFELLDPTRPKPYANVLNDSFRQGCKQLKEQYPEAIQKVCFKFLEGSSAPMFRNFIDANEIDIIFYPPHYKFVPINKRSADPLPLFRKSGIRVITEVTAPRVARASEPVNMLAPTPILMSAS